MIHAYLTMLDYRLMISEDDYSSMFSRIKNLIAQKYAQVGQIVILESNIRKYIPNPASKTSNLLQVPNENAHIQ
jgi:hypothetical protein